MDSRCSLKAFGVFTLLHFKVDKINWGVILTKKNVFLLFSLKWVPVTPTQENPGNRWIFGYSWKILIPAINQVLINMGRQSGAVERSAPVTSDSEVVGSDPCGPIPHVIEMATLFDSVGFLHGSNFLLHYIKNHPILSIELIMSKLKLGSRFNIFKSD
jgi:hypothetical protein